MGIRFAVSGLPPNILAARRSFISTSICDAIVRKGPVGTGGPINPKEVLKMFRAHNDGSGGPYVVGVLTVRVFGYPTETDGKCCNLACEIGTSLPVLLKKLGIRFNTLQCEVNGFNGRSGSYEVHATDLKRTQPTAKGGTDAEHRDSRV